MSDTNDGSSFRPFASIRRALRSASPGDVILILAGIYEEHIVLDKELARAGTPEAPIILRGEGLPKLRAIMPERPLIQVRLPHWRIEGLELDMGGSSARAVSFSHPSQGSCLSRCDVHGGTGVGISTSEGAAGVLIEHNHIHDFHQEKASQGCHGVVIHATSRDIILRGNHIHDTGGDAVQCLQPDDGWTEPAEGVLIENNTLESTRGSAVSIKTSHDIIVRGNRMRNFRGCEGGWRGGDAVLVHYSAWNVLIERNLISEAGCGICVGGLKDEGRPDPSRVVVRDNTIRDISLERARNNDAVGIRVNNASDVRLLHNTIERTGGFAVRLGDSGDGISRGVEVLGNTMSAAQLVRVGLDRPGLRMNLNRYSSGGLFDASDLGQTRGLAEWKRFTRLDADSSLEA
ncbi:right-handed parallel beta-helix repeat-containing protein [Cystobacter ferrugineus]|uniref:right-handed parallel beta-helix repeat-containing protein n=1 Tax=Cystobacter ferrugineus TaxID=83449 RepID=UPI0016511FED|nr:right-handed parallel beta-helix repeat-containing protein [Cystobacter ferrugineus]